MIQDGYVSHLARNTMFRNVQFESEVLNVTVLAVLTTALAYQLSAIFYNLFLGMKPKGRATASDIHKLILTETTASPMAVFAAIARVDIFDRLRFKGDLPRNVKIARRDVHISPRATLTLICLLLIAPLFNLITIFVVLQRDETLTFAEAKFQGVALGVSSENVTLINFTDNCERIPIRVVGQGSTVVQFHICFDFQLDFDSNLSESVRVSVETTSQGQIKAQVMSLPSEVIFSTAMLIDMNADEKLYRTEPNLSVSDASKLIFDAQKKLASFPDCGIAKEENSPQDESLLEVDKSNGLLKVSRQFENCVLAGTKFFIDVLLSLTERINPITPESGFSVTDVDKIDPNAVSSPEYFEPEDFRFITQRSRNANVLVVLVGLVVAILARMITSWFFNNDLDEALEAVVRYRLGVGPNESLLRSNRTIRYNSKGQSGSRAHYGLQRRSLPEVEQFAAGTEIGMEENETELRSRDEW